uniref:Protocadherin 9 n=1 Tax=Oncorhynchus kisutch TaxID=8019 RepID=A0A8C7GN97_ONCKI
MDLGYFYLLAALVACFWMDPSIAQELIYPIREELQENVLIGNIPKDLNVSHTNAATGASANLVYRLVSKAGDNPLLRVQSSTGEIFTTSNRIDRERLCPGPSFEENECSFEIEVVILPNDYFRLIKIKIVVKDTNDNAPMFPSPVINISIPENTLINSRFAIPSATDPDTGPNSVHKYQLVNGQSAFGLDIVETPEGEKWPQLIVQQNLDREQKDTYVMKIKVEDGGMPQKSSTAILQVTVTDVNDNKPVFRENQIEVHIPENSPIGTSVVQLQATDADVGANAEIKYMFGTQVSPATKRLFALNGTTGLITVQRPLDREETTQTPGENAAVTLSILSDNENFILDPYSGVIKSNVSFDREQQSSYTFDVRAVDSGRPPCSSAAKVTINVIDVNDNTPIVIYPPSNTSFKLVPLSSIPGSVVAEVFAVDGDTGMNAELKYTIVSGNITLEEKPAISDIGLHRLVVNISDLGYPKSLHTLVLVFLYVNDTVGNATFIYDLIRRTMETPLDRNIGESSETYQSGDYLTIMIAIVAGAMVVIVVIFVTVLVRCRHTSRFKAAQRKKQGAEWMSPNQENKQNKKKKRKKRKSPKSSLLNFVTIEENKPDDPAHEPINGNISLPAELEEPGHFDWNAAPTTTFKPSSPDLARHYKSASPQSAFHLKADTPVSVKKHHMIQELPLDNTFVGGCDTLSKRSSTSSDHFSASECSSQGGFKTKGSVHPSRQVKDNFYWSIKPSSTTTPVGETSTTTTPVGETSSTTTPVGETSTTTTPVGEPSSSTTPVGEPSSTTTPVGEPSTTTTPVGEPSSTTTPVGETSSTTTPVGEPSTTTTPVGEPSSTTTPVGEPSTTTTPVGEPSTTTPVGEPSSTTTPVGEPSTTTPVGEPSSSTTPVGETSSTTTPVGEPSTTTTHQQKK